MQPLENYYTHKAMADGHINICKGCTKDRVKSYRKANIETIREHDKKRGMLPDRVNARKEYRKTEKGKLAVANAHKRYKEKNPLRHYARLALNNALRDGRIDKHLCFICGDKSEAHHPDYSRPLDVMWLCNKHHREAHLISQEQ